MKEDLKDSLRKSRREDHKGKSKNFVKDNLPLENIEKHRRVHRSKIKVPKKRSKKESKKESKTKTLSLKSYNSA